MNPFYLHICCALIVFFFELSVVFSQKMMDVTSTMGIKQYSSNQRFGTGVSSFDMDNDGWVDLHFSTAYGEQDLIYKNIGGNRFKEVSAKLGLNLTAGSIASLWMDYNGDHLVDLLIMNACNDVNPCEGKTLQLFEQQSNGIFVEVTTQAGLDIFTENHLKTVKGGLSAGDLNLDGHLDIILTFWSKGQVFAFMNDGKGNFEERGADLGIFGTNENFFQPLIWDADGDGDPDLYVNVDAGPNRLYINDDLKFTESAAIFGLDANNNEMGIAIGDYDNNGVFDIFMTNIDYEALFGIATGTFNVLYQGSNAFEENLYRDVADATGVKSSGWGWGTTFMDVNNDGFQDLAATNGVDNIADPSKFWLNQTGNNFIDISDQIGFNDNLDGSSLISLDYDQDGDLDMIQTTNTYAGQSTSVRLLQNDCTTCGHYIQVRPRMLGNNHFAIGATVKVKAGNKQMMRLISAGTSYYAQEAAEAHFGLGSASMVDEIKVIWPGGAISVVNDIAADQIIEITDSDVLHSPRFTKNEKVNNRIHLEWNHINSIESKYEIEVADNSTFSNSAIYEVQAPSFQYSFEGMMSTETIFARIRAGNDRIVSKWSKPVQIETLLTLLPKIDLAPLQLIYPNPSSYYINLPANNPHPDQLKVINTTGQSFILDKTDGGSFSVKHLPQGIYFVIGDYSKKLNGNLRFVKLNK